MAAEHEVWFSDGATAWSGRVTAIDDAGSYTVVDEAGDHHEQLKREQIRHPWQLEKNGRQRRPRRGWHGDVS